MTARARKLDPATPGGLERWEMARWSPAVWTPARGSGLTTTKCLPKRRSNYETNNCSGHGSGRALDCTSPIVVPTIGHFGNLLRVGF
jgi:hypothetical protein